MASLADPRLRRPDAPRQTWIFDEAAQLGAFPLITKLYTYGVGIGIRPWAVFQSVFQMKALGPNAANIIASSAACQIYFAIRDPRYRIRGRCLPRARGADARL